MSEELIKCPKCGSTQVTANKQGFSGKKAVAGAVLTGGIGLLAGTIGSNKVKITCLACGNEWKPGEQSKAQATTKPVNEKQGCAILIFLAIVAVIVILLIASRF